MDEAYRRALRRVHPRGRGEQWLNRVARQPGSGPSPRARGAGRPQRGRLGVRGSIPAGAGSRTTAPTPPGFRRVHPRGRGEQIWVTYYSPTGLGPSPRARGAAAPDVCGGRRVGSIPAGAGSRTIGPPSNSCSGVHPRGRGEQNSSKNSDSGAVGPSPRARGAVPRRPWRATRGGSIPAGAGSSRWLRDRMIERGVHPRGRGEQVGEVLGGQADQGPSPRARGADVDGLAGGDAVGSIPAGAGSSFRRVTIRRHARVHPRGRGEQVGGGMDRRAARGPSPRARGAVPSSACTRYASPAWVHPRGRGEQYGALAAALLPLGPSPRARGAANDAGAHA